MREEPAAEPADHAAQAVIARQAAEIAHLRQLLAEEHLAADLREALGLTAVAAVLARPIGEQRLLEMILGTAMQAIAAHAGALFLVDEERGDLIFRVALGGQAEEVRDLRVPLGHGVAGLVAVSGQPMIVSNAEEDARQASDIAARVHYQPRTMLCVPLLFDDRVIGVLELLDKVEASSFTMDDMAMLSRFAEQAAVAIEQAHVQYNLTRMLQALIAGNDTQEPGTQARMQRRAADFVAGLDDEGGFRRAADLAVLIREIVRQGEGESRACTVLLEGFASYLRERMERQSGY